MLDRQCHYSLRRNPKQEGPGSNGTGKRSRAVMQQVVGDSPLDAMTARLMVPGYFSGSYPAQSGPRVRRAWAADVELTSTKVAGWHHIR
jgi:hypothetical protein